MLDLFAALGLALILEGAAYALFPDAIKRALVSLLALPEGTIRAGGLAAALAGLLIVVLARGGP